MCVPSAGMCFRTRRCTDGPQEAAGTKARYGGRRYAYGDEERTERGKVARVMEKQQHMLFNGHVGKRDMKASDTFVFDGIVRQIFPREWVGNFHGGRYEGQDKPRRCIPASWRRPAYVGSLLVPYWLVNRHLTFGAARLLQL